MSDTVGYRARGAIKGLVDTVWDMLGDLPASGTSTAAQRGLPELGGRCYSASALTAGTAVYVSTRTAVGGFPVATVSAAATGTNVATYIMGSDIAAGGTGTMVKGAIIKTALDAHLSSVGAAVYFGAAGLPTLTPGSQQVGRVHTATTNAYVAFDVWDSGGVAAVGTFAALDGTAAAPGYAFAGSGGANEGLYRPGNGEVALALNGLAALDFASSAPSFSAGADTAGQDVYVFAATAGGSATAARTGAAFRIRSGAGSPGATTIASGDGGAMAVLAGGGGNKTGTTGATGTGGSLSGSAGAGGDNATVTAVAAGIGGAANYASGGGGNQTGAGASGAGGAGGTAAYGSGAGGNASGAGSTGDGGAGGQLSTTAGAGGTSVGGTGGVGGAFLGRGGAGGVSTTGNGGAGGATTVQSGVGATGVVGGAGGAHTSLAGAGGVGTTTSGGGGAASFTAGAGATASLAVAGGIGGDTSIAAGAGGAKTGTGSAAGGAGGSTTVSGGVGGATASSGANAGGAGGSFTGQGAAGGAATAGTGVGGAGGTALLKGGVGGASAGGAGGAGGSSGITAGAAGASGASGANGGGIPLTTGAGTGSGVDGIVYVANATTPVAQTGPVNQTAATVANAGTISAAQHRGQCVYQDASGGNVTMKTLTGTLLAAAFPLLPTGGFVHLYCTSNDAANTSTLSGDTDATLVGSGAFTQTGATFVLRKTGATTFDILRVG